LTYSTCSYAGQLLRGILLIAIVVLLSACSRTSDEQQIRIAIEQMQEALEAGKPSDFMQYIADDFTGADSGIDRQALHNLLRAQVLANSNIAIAIGPIDIELHDQRATVNLSATITGGNARWIPERGSIQRIKSGWRRENGEWKCINAQWERTL
jgi:hypothetical protein